MRTNVATGTGLTATAWNGKGFTIPSSDKMQWAKEINAQWEIREWEERLRKAEVVEDEHGTIFTVYVDGVYDEELTKLYREYKKVEINAFWSGFVDQLLNNNGKTITDETLGKLFGKITIGEKYTIYQNYQNGQTWGNFVSLAQGVVEVLIGGVMNIGGKGGGLVLAPETGGASVAVGEGVSLAGVAVGAHGSVVATLAFSGLMSGGNNLPEHVQDSFDKHEEDGWKGRLDEDSIATVAGDYHGNYDNLLPRKDAKGNKITYREFDVNSKKDGFGRDAERFVVGSDGSVYYTSDHYLTFTKLK